MDKEMAEWRKSEKRWQLAVPLILLAGGMLLSFFFAWLGIFRDSAGVRFFERLLEGGLPAWVELFREFVIYLLVAPFLIVLLFVAWWVLVGPIYVILKVLQWFRLVR